MKNQSLPNLRGLALGLAGMALLQSSALAQLDSAITNVDITQAINNHSAGMEFAAGRTTFIRAETTATGVSLPVNLDGIMRVFVNGVEAPDSPVFSVNGPYPAQASSNLNMVDGTLNFIYMAPISPDVVFTVELNPAGPNFVPEANLTNNTMSSVSFAFVEQGVPEFAYSPIDYRPNGGGANVPNATLIEPGRGDNFIQGIFPVKDIYYHRTDAPSKLWTNSLSGSGSALNNSLLVDRNMMVPKPDFLYGWVPGGLPYNGQSILNSPVSMGNTQSFKYQRTYAHEVGHNIGRSHVNQNIVLPGIDVEHHLALPASNNLGVLKGQNLNDIMVAGLNTNQAWVRASFYKYAFQHSTMQATDDDAAELGAGSGTMLNGIWNRETGVVQLSHVLDLPEPVVSTGATTLKGEFTIAAYSAGQLVYQQALAPGGELDNCAQTANGDSLLRVVEVPINVILPRSGAVIDRVEIIPAIGVNAQALTLVRSANAPVVSFVTPGLQGDVSAGLVNVSWTAADLDGDALTYYLRYSRDGVQFTPLASGISETNLTVDLRELPALVDGMGFFQLLASDGLNTTVIESPFLTGGGNLFASVGNDPWVEIVTPDNDTGVKFGAPAVLHSSGWDLEDRSLGDPAITWSSSLDGALGTGRLLSVTSLSIGTHQITVTATDSDGQTATDTHLLSVTFRQLPDVPSGTTTYCTSGTSANGCQAMISSTGTPSATASSGFTLDCSDVEGSKDGQFFFGANGRQANTWGSGTSFQCVLPPTKRGGVQVGNGTLGACDGAYSQDMNARWQAKPAQNPGAGAVVQAQFWYRDPQNTSNQTTSLSNAIEFTVEP